MNYKAFEHQKGALFITGVLFNGASQTVEGAATAQWPVFPNWLQLFFHITLILHLKLNQCIAC